MQFFCNIRKSIAALPGHPFYKQSVTLYIYFKRNMTRILELTNMDHMEVKKYYLRK